MGASLGLAVLRRAGGACDATRLQCFPLHPSPELLSFLAPEDSIFGKPAVADLLRGRMGEAAGRQHIFVTLAEHEVEGVRFLTAAQELPAALCGNWDRAAHLRDEMRHVRYFYGLARKEGFDVVVPPLYAPLTDSEQSVFDSPSEFLASLYVAEVFSAAYLQALRAAAPSPETGGVNAVLSRALRDEEKHARWIASTLPRGPDPAREKRFRAHWHSLEIALFESLLGPSAPVKRH